MPRPASAPPPKSKKANRIITDLSNITQDDEESDPEASEFDLGTKIKTPKDTMLEELSLNKNKGSKMFRMRQQRVEKFIISNEGMNLQNLLMSPPTPPPKPEPELKEEVLKEVDLEAEKERKRREYVRSYVSPWERAMKGNQELMATMKACMPGPYIYKDFPQFKSFNKTALPYGGTEKASRLLTFEVPEINAAPEEVDPLNSLQADIRSRPSFNRTPIGWVCSEDTMHLQLQLDSMPFDGETDDL